MFVTIEGIEGSGKTTQVRLVAEALGRDGRTVRVAHEPGDTPLGARIRELLLHGGLAISPRAELHLLLADRAEHVSTVIRPALERGEIVLCDRFSESTLAYQAFGRGLPADLVRSADAVARAGLVPDLTFVLDCAVGLGLERTNARRGAAAADRFESEDREFHERVRRGFLALAEESPGRIRVLDATRPPERIRDEILDAMRSRIGDAA